MAVKYGNGPYAGGFMATARLDFRLDEEIKAKAENASALLGLKSLTEYAVRLFAGQALSGSEDDTSHLAMAALLCEVAFTTI
jgi:low affinity Fe/Cu permease